MLHTVVLGDNIYFIFCILQKAITVVWCCPHSIKRSKAPLQRSGAFEPERGRVPHLSHLNSWGASSQRHTEEVHVRTACFGVVALGTGQGLPADYFHDRDKQEYTDKSKTGSIELPVFILKRYVLLTLFKIRAERRRTYAVFHSG